VSPTLGFNIKTIDYDGYSTSTTPPLFQHICSSP
jgi:hypothetical protein